MLLEAETNKHCPGGYDIGAISNLKTWVLNFFLSERLKTGSCSACIGPRGLTKSFSFNKSYEGSFYYPPPPPATVPRVVLKEKHGGWDLCRS
jgi:hypothetical protein